MTLTRPDIHPYQSLKHAELCRVLYQLSEDQRAEIERRCHYSWFATRTTMAMYYQEAVRLGWLMGPF